MTETVIRTSHSLDPLTADEFRQAVSILRRDQGVGDRWRFALIELAEPSKREIAAFDGLGSAPDRPVCFGRDANSAYKAVVSLSGDNVLSWMHVCPGASSRTSPSTNGKRPTRRYATIPTS